MPLAAQGAGSEAFLTSPGLGVALALCTTLAGLAMLVLQAIAMRPRRRVIKVGMLASARLVDRSVPLPHLHVLYGEEELADAHVSTIALAYRGEDIRKNSFEGQPFVLDVGSRIIDLLAKNFVPDQGPLPGVEAVGTSLRVGPSVVRNGQEMTFLVLTDGPCALSTAENPLAGVDVEPGADYQLREDAAAVRRRALGVRLGPVLGWAVIVFAAFYLITRPTAATHFLNDVGAFFSSL